MSVICQNFVQNTWKKDLCSNCFKSFGDHHHHHRNGFSSKTIQDKRALSQSDDSINTWRYPPNNNNNNRASSCVTWKSLLNTRHESAEPFKLENGFHGKLLTIAPTGEKVAEGGFLNGTNGHNGQAPATHCVVIQGILKTSNRAPHRKNCVGFAQEQPQVIGYGGTDFYDTDDQSWEGNSDDGDPSDATVDLDDEAVLKVTKENTHLNSITVSISDVGTGAKDKNSDEGVPESGRSFQDENRVTKESSASIYGVVLRRKDDVITKETAKSFLLKVPWKDAAPTSDAQKEPASSLDESDVDSNVSSLTSAGSGSSSPLNGVQSTVYCSTVDNTLDKVADESQEVSPDTPAMTSDLKEVPSPSAVNHTDDPNMSGCCARTSFLHGDPEVRQEEIISSPSAVYTPGSDFFVARDSVSSNSSDDVNMATETGATEEKVDKTREDDKGVSDEAPKPERPRTKPKIPAKPSFVTNEIPKESIEENVVEQPLYYDVAPSEETEEAYPQTPINHYAECSIYQEINRRSSSPSSEDLKECNGRESKLASLAMELEQARFNNGMKRQAPAPPKIPDPPTERPPSSLTPAASEESLPVLRSKGLSMTPSLPGSNSDNVKSYCIQPAAKSKSSFLLTQYSKCKNFALGSDDNKMKKKFSLKKLLKINKDSDDYYQMDPSVRNAKAWKLGEFDRSKMKLEIIHPMDLVNKDGESISTSSSTSERRVSVSSIGDGSICDQSDRVIGAAYEILPCNAGCCNHSDPQNHVNAINRTILEHAKTPKSPTPSRSSQSSGGSRNGCIPVRPPKPPPPPRANSLLTGNRSEDASCKTNEIPGPLPPKPQVPKRQYRPSMRSEYANLGDVRCIVAPKKPDRVATPPQSPERSKEKFSFLSNSYGYPPNGNDDEQEYQDVAEMLEVVLDSKSSQDRLNSVTPSFTTFTQEINKQVPIEPQMVSKITVPAESKDHSYSTIGKVKVINKDNDPNKPPPSYGKATGCKANIIEKPWNSLENSYAVISSTNHKILAKMLETDYHKEQFKHQKPNKEKLQWTDFHLEDENPVARFFDNYVYNGTLKLEPFTNVTLLVSSKESSFSSSSLIRYPVLYYIVDAIPQKFLPGNNPNNSSFIQASVLVIAKTEVLTIDNFIDSISSASEQTRENFIKEICFIMLQLIIYLKNLQVQGIEVINSSFDNLLLAKDENKPHTLLFLFDGVSFGQSSSVFSPNGDIHKTSLCSYALTLVLKLLQVNDKQVNKSYLLQSSRFSKCFVNATNVLSEEKAFSLSQAKLLLEFILWATEDIDLNAPTSDMETRLQRWLDIERTLCIQSLVEQNSQLGCSVFEEYRMQFLVRTTARNLKEVVLL